MIKRQIGNSDLHASIVGLGCMSLMSNRECEYLVNYAVDMGINYFDTADLYDYGDNERVLGNSLRGKRNEIILATKVGNKWNKEKEGWSWDPRKSYIKQAVKESLQRLQTDYIDLYQLHGGTIDDPIDETIEAFEELVQEGWIRYYGISSIRPNVIKEYVKKSQIISVMLQHSMLDRRPEDDIMPLLADKEISVITRGPIAKGLLSEAFISKLTNDGYLSYSYKELAHILPQLQKFAHEHSYRLEELALHYCLGNTPTATVVPGARTLEQLQNNLSSLQKPVLSAELLLQLKEILKKDTYTTHL
ncbi:aldo/keto reductase [Anaerobacillus alkaliphilus]|uniref:Aldo/keto reductase n=1 Tax=Anaerobacillus alkaliphilus TaxID=1548597 RepID=A0A4Q0W248_9BACI|nr:aldo/keto reductase [Anaerobacillus alkaliphilus]RXJ04611.1 aldo/keto reductase [Anaerobacillus alkaliphilus]